MKYCKYCGNQLFDEAVMCPKCHKSVLNTYKLTVYRDQFMVINTSKMILVVEIDGNVVGKIMDNETLDVELPEGMHKLEIYYTHNDRKRNTNIISVNLFKNVRFEVNWNNFLGKLQVFEKQI